MPSKTPHSNGDKPVENGIHNDADPKDNAKSKGKKGAKDGDEEMTVVVPPSKGSKKPQSSRSADADGDVAMGDEAAEAPVDPTEQAVAGKHQFQRQSNGDLACIPLLSNL